MTEISKAIRLYAIPDSMFSSREVERLRHALDVAANVFERDAKTFIDQAADAVCQEEEGVAKVMTGMARTFEQYTTEVIDLRDKVDCFITDAALAFVVQGQEWVDQLDLAQQAYAEEG